MKPNKQVFKIDHLVSSFHWSLHQFGELAAVGPKFLQVFGLRIRQDYLDAAAPMTIPKPRQMRDNIAATDLLALDIYDPAFKKRQVGGNWMNGWPAFGGHVLDRSNLETDT